MDHLLSKEKGIYINVYKNFQNTLIIFSFERLDLSSFNKFDL
jgi:hypothetical protein